jgi:hypothetical protein
MRVLRRGATATLFGAVCLVAAPLAAGASTTVPVVDSVAVNGANLTVNWTLNVGDATSVDAIVYDNTGAVIADDVLDPSVTTDTFYSLAAQSGYYVVISATDPSGTFNSVASAPLDVVEGPAVITGLSGTGGAVTVTWTNTSPDASGLDVVLYDNNGTMITDDVLSAGTTTDTFTGVADGQGYYVVVTTHTPSGDFDSNASASFSVTGGLVSTDSAASITDLTCVDGTLSVSWSSNSPDATGYDVVLRDANGNIVSQATVDASVTSYSFSGVSDGDGYVVQIVAHTPIGDLTTDSWTFSIASGQMVDSPIIPPIVVGNGGSEVVDPSTVTYVATTGGWTVSWAEVADAASYGYYVVTDDQGDSCTVSSTGVGGATVSCDVIAAGDPTVAPSGLSVTYYSAIYEFRADNFGSVTPLNASGGVSTVDTTPRASTPTRTASFPIRHIALVSAPLGSPTHRSVFLDYVAGLAGLLMLSALILSARRRMHPLK